MRSASIRDRLAARPTGREDRGRRALAVREYGIVFVFVALFVVLAVSADAFLREQNLLNILDQWSAPGIMACGVTLVLIAGGLDLSVGAIYALSGVIAAKVAVATSVEIGFLAGIFSGLAMGAINGLLVTLGRINSFIATLGSSIVFRGLALIVTGGFLVQVPDEGFKTLGRSEFLGAKISVYIFAGFIVLCAVILGWTVLGRYIFAAGGNAEAARLSGVRVGLIQGTTFAVSGLGAGLAGVIVASRGSTGAPDAGVGIELTVIAAVVLGGTSILGGEGAIWRTVLGVLVLALIGNGLNLLSVGVVYQSIVQGGILLGAVAIDGWARRGRVAGGPRRWRLPRSGAVRAKADGS